MEHTITDQGPDLPEQRVTLDMSVAEFAVLRRLVYAHLSGNPRGIRGAVEAGLNGALADLHPGWAQKVRNAVFAKATSPAAAVEAEFGRPAS